MVLMVTSACWFSAGGDHNWIAITEKCRPIRCQLKVMGTMTTHTFTPTVANNSLL